MFYYHDPESGWFTQQDPIGLAGRLSFYACVPNAMSLIEPRGLNKYSNGVLLTVNNPKILKITKLTNLERDYPERYFREKRML